jgi:hypothetical protein
MMVLRGDKVKNPLLLAALLLSVNLFPVPTMARVDINVSIGLPPPIVFGAPPHMIVLPETYVYVVPDIDEDIFFYGGWWWRPWEGRWYRSRHYDSGWAYYRNVPSFYREIPSDWRNDYGDHQWRGRQWNYQQIPHQQVQQNWRGWERNRHWENQQTWGVQGLQSRKRPPQQREVARPQQPRAVPQKTRPVQTTHVTPPHRQQGAIQSREGKPEQPQRHQEGREQGIAGRQDRK